VLINLLWWSGAFQSQDAADRTCDLYVSYSSALDDYVDRDLDSDLLHVHVTVQSLEVFFPRVNITTADKTVRP